jgi:hypothetical protein
MLLELSSERKQAERAGDGVRADGGDRPVGTSQAASTSVDDKSPRRLPRVSLLARSEW